MAPETERVLAPEIERDCFCAGKRNRENLKMILQDNRDTEYGEKYHFSEITGEDEYREYLPLTEYTDFEKSIERMALGEKNILTAYTIDGYCHSSGTSSTGKKNIPITKTQLEQYANSADAYVDRLLEREGGKRLQLAVWRTSPEETDGFLLYTEIYYRNKARCGRMKMEEYVGGKELIFQKEPGDILFAKCFAALLEEDIVLIEAIYLYDLLHFFCYLEDNFALVLQAIRERRFPEEICLSESLKKKLLSIEVSGERLEYVDREVQKGFEGIAGRLWPGLRLISGISSREFSAEDASLHRFTGDIPEYYYIYCSSECYVGNPVALNDFRYVMVPDKAFFEFLPFDEENKETETLLPQETKEGCLYELVVTNYAGLYRYRMGDIVRITGHLGESPVMEHMMRRDLSLNIVGEKVNLLQLEQVMEELKRWGVEAAMYCFAVDIKKVPGRYLAAISLNTSDSGAVSEEKISQWLDEALMRKNIDYADLRRLKEIAAPKVRLFEYGAYMDFITENGLLSGHNKPKHIAPKGFRRF